MELTKVMAGIPDYSKEDSQMVVTLLNKHLGFEWEHSGVDFLQIALEKGFGSEKANEILAEVSVSLSAEEKETLFDFLLEYPMPDVIFVLSGEPNRIAAIVLNHMDPSVAHDLLDHLEERRNDIKDAMDSLSEVDPHILIQTRKHIEEQVENSLFLLDHMQKTMN
jgi:flagellar motor switch protein FliG